MSKGKRFTRGERALIGLGILVPTVMLAWMGMDRKLNTVPEFVPPTQHIPAPNAQDTLRNAYALRVNTWPKPNMRFEDMLKAPLPERQKYLEANQKTIATIRTALEQGYATPIDWRNPVTQTFPHYAEQRELARLLTLHRLYFGQTPVNEKIALTSALVRELHLQSQLLRREGGTWQLRVDRETLNQAGARDRLQTALAELSNMQRVQRPR